MGLLCGGLGLWLSVQWSRGVYRVSDSWPWKIDETLILLAREYIRRMSLPSPWDTLTLEDMPAGGLQTLARKMGPSAAALVWKTCRGTRLEPPSRFPRRFMLRYIHTHWNGSNAAELARALEIHQRTVERLLDVPMEKTIPEDRQLSFI